MLRTCRFDEAHSKFIHQSLHHSPIRSSVPLTSVPNRKTMDGLSFHVLLNENGAGRFGLTKAQPGPNFASGAFWEVQMPCRQGLGLSTPTNLYAPPLHVGPARVAQVAARAVLEALRGSTMQYAENRLRRIPLLRGWVNKGNKEDSRYTPAWALQ